MKKFYILIAFSSFLFLESCKKEEFNGENIARSVSLSACGGEDSVNNLVWLKNLISKAEEDKVDKKYKGNYQGTIYLVKYRNQDMFFVDMMLGSGGIYGYLYRCDGSLEDFNKDSQEMLDFYNSVKRDKIIYSNVP